MVMFQDLGALNVGGVASSDKECDMNLFHFWDFPLETVGVNDFVGDWDDSKSECLGPVPFETLMSPASHHSKFDHIDGTHEWKQLISYVAEDSGSLTLDQMKFRNELYVFQAHSPVSALESSGSCSTGILGVIPGKPRSKTVKQCPRAAPWSVMPPWHATKCCGNTYKRNQMRSKRFSQLSVAVELTKKICSHSAEQQSNFLLRCCGATKKCSHCQISKTPQWREGPMGPKTLCNACGVRYRSGRLFPEYRPAASPSFAPALHSNSHKKVLEMRNKANSKRS